MFLSIMDGIVEDDFIVGPLFFPFLFLLRGYAVYLVSFVPTF